MNSPANVAGSPAIERDVPERVPTDWKTGTMQKRIRRRYAAERRFRFFGLAAVVLSGGFLAFLLVTMLMSGIGGFQRTLVTLPIDFPSAGLEVDRAQLKTRGADLALAGAGLENTVNGAAAAAFGEENRVISDSAWLTVRDAIKADPSILSQKVSIPVPAAPGIEEAAKADGEPADEALVARLEQAGVSAIPLLRQLVRRLMSLAEMRADIDRGASPDEVVKKYRVFFREEMSTKIALRRWTSPMLARAVERVREAERGITRGGGNAGQVIADEALVTLARAASRGR